MTTPDARDRRASRRRISTLSIALAGLLLLIAGCGGSNNSDSSSAISDSTSTSETTTAISTDIKGFNPAQIFKNDSPGVVTIRSLFGSGTGGGSAAEGSGFVLSEDGEIVTNAHVVTDDASGNREVASQVFIEFPDRNIVSAKVLGYDPFYDVALLDVDPSGLDIHPLALGDDTSLIVGEPVAAIGSPFGEQQSLSTGVVSATDRSVKSLTQFQIEGAIQTDASINPGNSGGPLLDSQGRVIGINQQIETQSGANDGVGFAVPISAASRSIKQIRDSGEVAYPFLGVSTQSIYPQLAEKLGLATDFGGLVVDLVPGGPAAKAGLRAGDRRLRFQAAEYKVGGDVIIAVDGKTIDRPDDLSRYIASLSPGDTVSLEVYRDDEKRTIEVTLGERPTSNLNG